MNELSGYPPPAVIRSSHRRRRLRNRFRDHCQRINAPCRWCVLRGDLENSVIDYHAARFSPHSFEADHITPIDQRPDLA